jgi:ribose transport system substrate-binding protein
MKKLGFLSLTVVTMGLAGCAGKTGPEPTKPIRLAVIPQGTTHEFWKSIHAGAVKAAEELSAAGTPVEIIWKGPIREGDREQQIQVVEGFTTQGVDGIAISPFDDKALVRPVEEAQEMGIPTVVFDSALATDKIVSFVATDNRKGGALAADEMGRLLGGKGKVLVLRYQEGSASTMLREEGFLEKMKEAWPKIVVLSSDQYAGATRDTAKRASENLLNRFGGELDGIFTPNESSTGGMLLALQDIGKAGKITFLGFDSAPVFLDAMQAKQLQGFVVQNPFRMGYLSVKTMVDHLKGKAVEKRIDTGVELVTPANVETAEVQALLHPPIDKYLH